MGMSTISSRQTLEQKKRLTKLRSVKVVSLERSRSSLKHKKSGLKLTIIIDDISKQSPNYMRPTSCSNARRGSLKPTSADESTEIRSANRLLSLKRSRKNITTRSRLSCDDEASISCRGEKANAQLIKSGLIKLTTRKCLKFPRKQWSSSRFNRAYIFGAEEESPPEPSPVQGNETGEGFNSVDATGLKPVRALWKIPSMRNRRLLIKKQSGILDCSSTINNTKLRYSKPEVCQYKYCSVHGSAHESSSRPSLLSKKQKSRQQKYNKPGAEKPQTHEVTAEDLAGTSDKIISDMWNPFLLHEKEEDPSTSKKPDISRGEAVEFVQQEVDEILLLDRQLSNIHQEEDSSSMKLSKLPRSKGFEKIRKLIATTKFIKAMEKLRKEHAPRKVSLAHLSKGKNKSREEWMLDVAIQQVINKLDPDQQRRVGMLIHAFESVTQDTKIYCSSDHERVEPTESEMQTVVLEEDSNSKEPSSQDDVELRGTTGAGKAKSMMKVSKKLADPTEGNQEMAYSCIVDGTDGKDVDFHFDEEKFTNVWHQVYHHFNATGALNVKNDGAGLNMKIAGDIKHDTEIGNLEQDNAIQLVQEAIDELIHLQEKLSGKLSSELHSNVGEEKSFLELEDTHEAEIETRVSDRQMQFEQPKSKAYRKLRKMVVSATYITAMEKVRSINPRKTEQVSLEAERVYPRNWSMEDRKMSEEWTLDSALQEVINKLAPAKKKKVAMLTEAFEIFSSEIQQANKGKLVADTNPVYDTRSTNITENEQTESITIDQDDPSVYKNDIQTPDDEAQPGDNEFETFHGEFDTELYFNNVELAGVNLHIHDMETGSTKGCPVCRPHELLMHYKEKNKVNREHQLEVPTDSSVSGEFGDIINSYHGNEGFLDENKYSNMRHLIHQECEISSKNIAIQDYMNTKETELQQNEAIKFVQEAVDEILQMPEQPLDDQSVIQEDKPLQEVTGRYKALSKVILHKKLVRALEKMKKQRSEVGGSELESTPKRYHLKQQKENEMKNHELMLDFALQRVIANLGPAQKKKVSMLVEAFEKVAQ